MTDMIFAAMYMEGRIQNRFDRKIGFRVEAEP